MKNIGVREEIKKSTTRTGGSRDGIPHLLCNVAMFAVQKFMRKESNIPEAILRCIH